MWRPPCEKCTFSPVRASSVPPYNWPPCPLPPSASPLLARRSVGWMLSAVCALLHPQWDASRFVFFFPESDSIEINREDLRSDPLIQLFLLPSLQVDADLLLFFFGVRGWGTRETETYFPGLCKQVFPSPPAVRRGLLTPRQRSPTLLCLLSICLAM